MGGPFRIERQLHSFRKRQLKAGSPVKVLRRAGNMSNRSPDRPGWSPFHMMAGMLDSLVEHERIETTWTKACCLSSFAERTITYAKWYHTPRFPLKEEMAERVMERLRRPSMQEKMIRI